jgi:hypothetical protein
VAPKLLLRADTARETNDATPDAFFSLLLHCTCTCTSITPIVAHPLHSAEELDVMSEWVSDQGRVTLAREPNDAEVHPTGVSPLYFSISPYNALLVDSS